ncbi:MAG: DMT family transporter [Elusimicrobiales bacterium]|nr:DMT family transporter [Elusimicrobiales bacterium]
MIATLYNIPPMDAVYIYALAANLSFAIGVQFFTHYSRRVSSVWVNCFKACVAGLLFALTVFWQGGFHQAPPFYLSMFVVSGAIGLGLGDIFILKAFSLMGPGRTMMLFGLQPFVVGSLSWLAFGQTLEPRKAYAVAFFIVCLYIFSLESFRKDGHWNLKAGLFALLGIALDGAGIVLTRYGFDNCPDINTTEGNFYRAAGALLFFAVLSRFRPLRFRERLRSLGRRGLFWITAGSAAGTYLSLMFYLQAVRRADALAAVSGIAITGTLFAALFEHVIERKRPSGYLLTAFLFFFIGMSFLFG